MGKRPRIGITMRLEIATHRFYLGRSHAVTMLVITLISLPLCFLLIGFAGLAAVGIWSFVDLFSVSRWAKEHNAAVLARIGSVQA